MNQRGVRRSPPQAKWILGGLASLVFLITPVSGQTLFFDGWNFLDNTYTGNAGPWDAATTDWRNNGNTANVVWAAGNKASFQVYRGYVTMNVAQSATGLEFTNNSGGYRILGAGTLTLTGGATAINLVSDGFTARVETALSLAANSTFTNTAGGILFVTGAVNSVANQTLTIGGTGEVDISGAMNLGTGTLTMNTNGTGLLKLSAANTYSGGTTITNGTVFAQNATALGTGAITLNGGGLEIDNVTVGNNITAATGTTITGTGTAQANGTITLANAAAYTFNTGTSVSDTLTLGNGNNDLTGGNAATTITVGGSGTVVIGSGAQVSNNNLGSWTVNSGKLSIAADALLGNNANAVTLNGGTLQTTGTLTLNAGRVLTFGASGGTLETATGTTLTSGTAAQLSGSGALTKTGAGTFSVTGNSNAAFTGTVAVNNGTFSLNNTNGSMTGATDWAVNAGGILTLDSSVGTNNNRIGNTATVELQAGTMQLLAPVGAAATETVGALTLNAGDSTINVQRGNPGSSSVLTFSSLTANPGATINFTNAAGGGTLGNGGNNPRVIITGTPSVGITVGWAYVNNTDFASYNNVNGVFQTAAAGRQGSLNAAVAADDVRVVGAQVNLTANKTINSYLNTGAFNQNLGGFNLDITTGGLMKTGNNAMTISNGNLTAGAAAGAELFTNIVANTTTISANVVDNAGGAVDLVKAGAGTLVLSGAAANTFSGTTYVNEGTLQLNKTAGVNAIAGNATVGDGAGTDTLQLLASNQIADTSAVTVTRSGVFDLNGFNETIGSLTMEGGTGAGLGVAQSGAGTLTLAGDVALNANAQSLTSATITGNLSLGGATRTFTIADNAQVTRDMDISAVISDGGGASGVTKAGAGTLTFSGANANTYSGTTTVNGGTLELNKTAGVNAIAGNITISTGGTLLLAASNQIADTSNMTLSGGTFNTGGNSETVNNLTLSANSTIDMGSGASILKFSANWTPAGNTLTILNWTGLVQGAGTDQIFFGNAQTLTPAQLATITFKGYAPGALQLASGEIVPIIPEAGTIVAGLLLLGAVGCREYRRRAA